MPALVVLSVPVVQMAAERLNLAQAGPISILDVGGGAGVYSMIWLALNRRLRAVDQRGWIPEGGFPGDGNRGDTRLRIIASSPTHNLTSLVAKSLE